MIERSRVRVPAGAAGEVSCPGLKFLWHVKDPGHSAKKCGWQVAAKHTGMWLCMKSDMVHGCMVYIECAETATVSRGTSHVDAVSTPHRWVFKNAPRKAIHSCRIT